MPVSILGLSTAVPAYILMQEDFATLMKDVFGFEASKLEQLTPDHTAISKRHFSIPDFLKESSQWHFWGSEYPRVQPGTAKRNAAYKDLAPQLARTAAKEVLEKWGGQRQAITHVISVSCTGSFAPGLEFDLVQTLALNPTACRLGINFMGCYGAIKGLEAAKAFAAENPKNRILLVCTELCSLHLQADKNISTLTANAIFADGAAAAIVGVADNQQDKPLFDIAKSSSYALADTRDKMTWEACDKGFLMHLSHHVPVYIKRHIKPFVDAILQDIDYAACDFAVHPGGKSIIQAVEKALALHATQTEASWHTLANYGNMSSATFLFVLNRLLELKSSKAWTMGLGFGPGLAIEGLLLKRR